MKTAKEKPEHKMVVVKDDNGEFVLYHLTPVHLANLRRLTNGKYESENGDIFKDLYEAYFHLRGA